MTQTAKRTAGKTAKGATKTARGTTKAAGAAKSAGGAHQGLRDTLSKNPAAERLMGELQSYMRSRATGLVESLGDRIGDTAGMLDDLAATAGGGKKSSKGGKGKKGKSGGGGKGSVLKLGTKMLGGAVKNKVGDLLPGGGSDSSSAIKATVIEESIDIGVPVGVAYNQWTQFQEFGRFSKGVQSVNQEDEVHTNWKAKVAFSNRSWDATITEQIPDQRIAWTSDGSKGSVDGVVTFHELAPNLTRVLLELEYHPKGVLEKTGNLWRAQGRRARLDLKNFRHFVMVEGEETGSWRGEIRDSEVVHGPESNGRPDRERGRSSRRRGRRDERAESPRRERSERRERRDRDARDTGSSSRATARRRPSAREHGTRRSRGDGADEGDKSTATNAAAPATKETTSPRKKATSARKKTASPRKSTTPRRKSTTSPRKSTTSPTKKTTAARKTTTSARKTATPARKKTSAPARKRTTPTTKKSSPARKKTTTRRKTTTARRTSGSARKTAPRRR